MKTANTVKTSKINVNPHPDAKKEIEQYPCFCEVAEFVLFLGRLFGITHIVHTKTGAHGRMCKFKTSKYWRRYGYIVLVSFTIFAIIIHGIRFSCGPTISNTKFWYVMSIGYLINDLNVIFCMVEGTLCAERVCKILQTISALNGTTEEMSSLKSFVKKFIFIIFLCFLTSLCSYVYVSFLRNFADATFLDNHCNIPDYPFAVVIRGISLIYPAILHLILGLLCLVIKNKFKHLMEKTDETMAISSNLNACTGAVPNSLNKLSHDYIQICFCLREINACFGLQLLITITSMLFTTIYFLYRYSISSREMVLSNTNERVHYIIGALYRMLNLLHYMYLGRQITFWSQAPLRVLQNCDLLNLPYKIQQQVQIMLLQWSGRIGYLSALEVINIGPWLLAPIVGNVVTYLLVALQFENNNLQQENMTRTILWEDDF